VTTPPATLAHQWRALRSAPARSRRALVSAWAGFFVDMVDIYLPVVALAPALAYFHPSSLSTDQATLLFYATFAATLLGRPVGAVVFGHLADRHGRRRFTLVAIAGFSACTLLIGLLPGHAEWGFAAPVALVTLRFVDGIFLGGEYTSATPLAFEHCPRQARGLFGGLLMGAYACAYLAVSALVFLLLAVLPSAGADSGYVQWGWRVPFLLGGALGLVFLAYRAKVPESDLWTRSVPTRQPLRVLLTRGRRSGLGQVLLTMTGLWLVATSVVSIMPRLLATALHQSDSWITVVLMCAQVAVLGGFVLTGAISQQLGRRRTLVGGALVSGTAGLGLYFWMVAAGHRPWVLAILAVLTQTVVLGVWGVVTSYCNERFDTGVRASGFGTAYSLALVPAGFYGAYLGGLSTIMPTEYTQLVLLAVGALLAMVGAALGPETVWRDLAVGGPPSGPPAG
jgi:MFS family permease